MESHYDVCVVVEANAEQAEVEEALRSLSHRFDRMGARIAVARGEILSVLEHARSTLGVDAVVAHEETGPRHTYDRDNAVRRWCADAGLPFHEIPRNGVIRGLQRVAHG